MLPQGYAVKSATLKMRLASYPLGTPSIGAWESLQHNWSEDTATWATYDGTNAWGTSGAKGWEKSSLLDSVSITNSNVMRLARMGYHSSRSKCNERKQIC